MAQIFVSHSGRDRELVDFFARLGARSSVKLVFEELEKIVSGEITADRIRADIATSNALFLLLSPNVASLPHTRDWVNAESGAAANKDIWVFERVSDLGKAQVVTPFLRHLVLYEPTDPYFSYIASAVESYDDSQILGTMILGVGLGGLLGGGGGATIGALAGGLVADRSRTRPTGQNLRCGRCSSVYAAHLPSGVRTFRCPVCNTALQLQPPPNKQMQQTSAPTLRLRRERARS